MRDRGTMVVSTTMADKAGLRVEVAVTTVRSVNPITSPSGMVMVTVTVPVALGGRSSGDGFDITAAQS